MDDSLPDYQHMTWTSTEIAGPSARIDVRGVEFGDVLSASTLGDPSPWWAHVWPIGAKLAGRILEGPRLDGLTCLDLGCGSGVVGVALGAMGGRVTFADQSADALGLARLNAERNGLRDFELLQMDWSDPPARRFDRIFAADVLYDREHFNGLMIAFRALLSPDGIARVADPKRQPVRRLFGAAMDFGFQIEIEEETWDFLLVRLSFAEGSRPE